MASNRSNIAPVTGNRGEGHPRHARASSPGTSRRASLCWLNDRRFIYATLSRNPTGGPDMTQTFKHAVIACHPDAKSFTLSVAERYAETVRKHGHEVVVRDLYRMRFNPVLGSRERKGHPAKDIGIEWAALGR
jgi:hypothetical protein